MYLLVFKFFLTNKYMWSGAEIGALIITCGSVFTGLIAQIQLSRCKNIRCCFGLWSCDREVPDVEPNADTGIELTPTSINTEQEL